MLSDNRKTLLEFEKLAKNLTRKTKRNQSIENISEIVLSLNADTSSELMAQGLGTLTNELVWNFRPNNLIIEKLVYTISELKKRKGENIDLPYVRWVDLRIEQLDQNITSHYDRFSEFLCQFKYIAQDCLRPYIGHTLRISDTIANHGKSTMITPKDPKDCTVLLYDDKPRLTYSSTHNAKAYIEEMYGITGKFYRHYADFLDCSKRYNDPGFSLSYK